MSRKTGEAIVRAGVLGCWGAEERPLGIRGIELGLEGAKVEGSKSGSWVAE
jgi:hypothetical protein